MNEQDEKWEDIGKGTYRLKMHGGWLVRTLTLGTCDGGAGVSIIFVQDLEHSWRL